MSAHALAMFQAHGGRVGAARAAFGGDDWIDLSTGIAPWPFPVGDIAMGWQRLPEPSDIAALEAAAAEAFGVSDRGQVVAVPGTDLAMRLLAPLLGAQRPAVVRPGYAGHRAAWPDAVPITHDALATLASSGPSGPSGKDLLVLASPANPDGRVADPALLQALSGTLTVVVDEAYRDPGPGLCPHAGDALVVLRSFGKFYGLPGVRLGFVVAGADVATRLRTMLGDWPVSAAAVAIGTAAYRDGPWRHAQQARIAHIGAQLDIVLGNAGLDIIGSAPLFRLIDCPNAAGTFTRLARQAILTRSFADQPGRLRIGLPRDAAALARLAAPLEEFNP